MLPFLYGCRNTILSSIHGFDLILHPYQRFLISFLLCTSAPPPPPPPSVT